MSTAIFVKRLNALRPTDDQGTEALSKLKPGEQVRVEWKRVRNPKQHRLWWAMCQVLADNARYPCHAEEVSHWLLKAVGHSKTVTNPDGTTEVRAKSIAWGNCPQDEFDRILSAAIDIACEKIIPGTTNETLRAELEEIIAPRAA